MYTLSMPGKLSSSISAARLEVGVITEIDYENQSYAVRSEMSEQPSYRIPIMSPYIDSASAAGLKFCPEVGTTCIMASLSDGNRYILGFVIIPDTNGSLDAGFTKMVSGDAFWQGPEGNFVRLRSGGIVEIGSTPVCTSIYIPTRNILHSICENFILDTFAGSLEFKVNRPEDEGDGHQKCTYSMNVKEFSDDENELVRVNVGSLDNKVAVSLVVKDSGKGETVRIKLELTKEGSLTMSLSKDISINLKGNFSLAAEKDVTIDSKQNTTISARQKNTVKGSTVDIKANSTVTVSGQTIDLKGTLVNISNSAAFPAVRATPDLIALLTAVSAVVKVPLSPAYINYQVKV